MFFFVIRTATITTQGVSLVVNEWYVTSLGYVDECNVWDQRPMRCSCPSFRGFTLNICDFQWENLRLAVGRLMELELMFWIFTSLHPGRLTWNIQITQLKRNVIFQTIIFRFRVNLPGCKQLGNSWIFITCCGVTCCLEGLWRNQSERRCFRSTVPGTRQMKVYGDPEIPNTKM